MHHGTTNAVPTTWVVPGYLDEAELGTGASGRVVRARHTATGRAVAIKYLAERLRADRGFRAVFRSEAQLLSELRSPHVVRMYEYVEDTAGVAIVMELVEGIPLRAVLEQQGAIAPEAALLVLKGSLLGLAAAHDAGMVHRDYKPDNVLVTAEGASMLVDFGIAVRSGSTPDAAGTPSYMAPEQWRGSVATPATDVYAATATFFESLTGMRPYSGVSAMELGVQHIEAPIPDALAPESVRSLIRRGLAKTPGDRPTTAAAFLAEVEAVAVARYGTDWERRGQVALVALAALLPWLFPAAATTASTSAVSASTSPAGTSMAGAPGAGASAVGASAVGTAMTGASLAGTASARTSLARRARKPAAAAAVAVVLGVVVAAAAWPSGHQGGGTAAPMPATSPAGPSAAASPEGTTAFPEPSGSADATPSPGSTASTGRRGSRAVPTGAPTRTPGSTVTSGVAPAPVPTGSGTGSPGGTGVPTTTSSSAPLDVRSVTIDTFSCTGRQASAVITARTNAAADGSVTVSWFHADDPELTTSTVEVTQTFALPRGRSQVSVPAGHYFDGGAWWGVSVSTSPPAARGNASYQVRDALSCDPPR
ncbi:protein kinase [Streptomyces sp. NPDC051976]|uniref:serine/threonine-protein kinase n=1 Tax=Streptomyces sp. NPDC051976 TaxID=3154947 RepID=UPI00341497BC